MSIIENTRTSDNSNNFDSYKENWLFMIARYWHLYGDYRYTKMHSEAGFKYLIKNKDNEKSNALVEKEKINYQPTDFLLIYWILLIIIILKQLKNIINIYYYLCVYISASTYNLVL